jgi:ribosomal protein S18 acetylase RimI-like enzyme
MSHPSLPAAADSAIAAQLSETELAAAVEANLFALFRAMAALPDSELVETEGLSRHLAFPTNPMFKGVWRAHLPESEADAAIDDTIAWFRARGAPFFFWWTGPTTAPRDLGVRLAARGLLSMEAQMEALAAGIHSTALGAPGMVADLREMNEAALTQAPPGFAIEEVRDEAALYDFKRVLIAGYEMPEWAANGWVEAALRVGIGQTPWKMYLGRLNGEPVATNMLFNGGGVASVYGVATAPSARGKGIGGAITLAPLLEARAAGYRYAVLFASEMGIHAYERIGFRLCDVRINRFLWRASA